jgi:hypothetical protein
MPCLIDSSLKNGCVIPLSAALIHVAAPLESAFKQEAQGPYRSPEYQATKNAFNLNACYNHMPNS